ncbi:MAG: MarR family transcriptional regulator [Dehalococcoidia bacterium]
MVEPLSSSQPGGPEEHAGDEPFGLAFRYNSIAIHLTRRLREADTSSGVPPARLSALSVLVFGGPHILGDLARRERVTPPTMTRIVTGLERMGLARRRPDVRDARLVWVEATVEGREVMERARLARVERLAEELRVLPEADREALDCAARILLALEHAAGY